MTKQALLAHILNNFKKPVRVQFLFTHPIGLV